MTWKPPLPEGLGPAQRRDSLVLHCDATLRAARSLGEMAADWQFFTIGCLYSYGGLDGDIIAEFTQTHADPDCSVMKLNATRPLFDGICPPGWKAAAAARQLDNELLAVPREYWDELRGQLVGTAMVDRRRGRFARATVQDLEIVDPMAVDNAIVATPRPPTLTIAAFGVDGTHHHVGFVPRVAGPYDRAAVIKLPIRPETIRVGLALLAGDAAPLAATLTPPAPAPADPAAVAQKVREAQEKVP
jgi:hypothetical protein